MFLAGTPAVRLPKRRGQGPPLRVPLPNRLSFDNHATVKMAESDQGGNPATTSEQATTAGNSPGKEPPNIMLGIQSALRYQLVNGPPPTTVTVPSYPSFLSLPPPTTQTGISANGTRLLSSISTQGEGAASPARLSSSGASTATQRYPSASRSFRHRSLDGPRLRQSASGASPNAVSPASPFSTWKPQAADSGAPPAPQPQHHVASVSSMITDMLYGMAQRRRDSLKHDTGSSVDGSSSTAAAPWSTASTNGGTDLPRTGGGGGGGGGTEQAGVLRARLQRSSTMCPAVGSSYGGSSPSRTAVSYKYDMSGYDAARHAMMKQQSYGDAVKPPAGSDRPGASGSMSAMSQAPQGPLPSAGTSSAGGSGVGSPSVRFAGLGLGRADRSVSTNGGGGGSGGARSSISGRCSTPGSPASPSAAGSHLGMRGSLSGARALGGRSTSTSGAGGARVSVDGGMLGEGANTQQRPRTSAVLQAMRSSKQLSPPGTIWPPPSSMQHAVRQHAYGSCPGPITHQGRQLHDGDIPTLPVYPASCDGSTTAPTGPDGSSAPAPPAVPAPYHSPASSRSRVRISIPDTAGGTDPGSDTAAGEPGAFGDRLGHLQLQGLPQQPTVITGRDGISNGRFQMSKRWSAITMAMAAAAAVEGAAAADSGSTASLPAAPASPVLSPSRPIPTAANQSSIDSDSPRADDPPTPPAPHPDPTAPPPPQPAPTAFPSRPATPTHGPVPDAVRPRLASPPPPQQPPAPTRGSRTFSTPEAGQQPVYYGTPEAGQQPVYYGTPGLRILVGWSGGPGGSPVLPGGGASPGDSCDPVVRSRTSSRASSRASTPSGRASSRMGQLLVAPRSGPSVSSGGLSFTGLPVGFVGVVPTGGGTAAAAAAANGTETGTDLAALDGIGGVGVTGLGGSPVQVGAQQQEEGMELQEADAAEDEDGGAREGKGGGGGGGGPGLSFYEQLQQLQAMAVAAAERERERAGSQGHGGAARGRSGGDAGTAGGAAEVAGVIRTILGRESMVAAQRVAATGSHLRTGRHQQVGGRDAWVAAGGCKPSITGSSTVTTPIRHVEQCPHIQV